MPMHPLTAADVKRQGTTMFFGYPPEKGFIIRAPVRAYDGRTYHTKFDQGEAVYPPLPDLTVDQAWARAERLAQFKAAGYAVYELGREPVDEPMWAGQDLDAEELADDFSASGFGYQFTSPAQPESEFDAVGFTEAR